MPFPIDDWQFYVVSGIAVFGLWIVVRPFVGKRSSRGCPGCSTTPARKARTSLTVRGQRP